MKINEVVNNEEDKLPFNVIEDLHYFMLNDSLFYRENYYPLMCQIGDRIKESDTASIAKSIFPMIDKAADVYCRKFKLSNNSNDIISFEERKELAKKIYAEEMPRIRKGDYT
jgi:hypothetical protein